MNKFIIILALFSLCSIPSLGREYVRDEIDIDIDTLAIWLEGSFSSSKQAGLDSSYEDSRLEIHRFWMDRTDGVWMMWEHSNAVGSEMPQRRLQRVLQIRRVEENMIEVRVYSWNAPDKALGLWQDLEKQSNVTTKDLRILRGCEWYLQRDAISFFGSSHGMACAGQSKGASYSTTEVKISAKLLSLWDREFASTGAQVSGARNGPYYFLRQNP